MMENPLDNWNIRGSVTVHFTFTIWIHLVMLMETCNHGFLKVLSIGCCTVHYHLKTKNKLKFSKNLLFHNSPNHSFKPITIIPSSVQHTKPQLLSTLCDMRQFMSSLFLWLLGNSNKVWKLSTAQLMKKNLRISNLPSKELKNNLQLQMIWP